MTEPTHDADMAEAEVSSPTGLRDSQCRCCTLRPSGEACGTACAASEGDPCTHCVLLQHPEASRAAGLVSRYDSAATDADLARRRVARAEMFN